MKRSKKWLHALWILALVGGLAVLWPWLNRKDGMPTPLEILISKLPGGKPVHYPLSGTVASRMEDFYARHPELALTFRDVPDEENGFLRFREFATSGISHHFAQPERLQDMTYGEEPWNAEEVAAFLGPLEDQLDELREIGRLPDSSSAGVPFNELMFHSAVDYKRYTDALALSMVRHLHDGNPDAALEDFRIIYGLTAHLDRIEQQSLLSATIRILCRMSVAGVLQKNLDRFPVDTDWSPWIEVLRNKPDPTLHFAETLRGEINVSMGSMLLPVSFRENNIPDFTAFEDAYANRMKDFITLLESGRPLLAFDPNSMQTAWHHRESRLSKQAKELLELFEIGLPAWAKGLKRVTIQADLTLASLEILQAEQGATPIERVDDPRWKTITPDPVTGDAFILNPKTRELHPAPNSYAKEDVHIVLPAPAAASR